MYMLLRRGVAAGHMCSPFLPAAFSPVSPQLWQCESERHALVRRACDRCRRGPARRAPVPAGARGPVRSAVLDPGDPAGRGLRQ